MGPKILNSSRDKAENRQRFEPEPRTNCQENHMRRWTASIWRSRASIEGAAETGIPSRSGVILNATQRRGRSLWPDVPGWTSRPASQLQRTGTLPQRTRNRLAEPGIEASKAIVSAPTRQLARYPCRSASGSLHYG